MPHNPLQEILHYFNPPGGIDPQSGLIGVYNTLKDQVTLNNDLRNGNPDEADIFIVGAPHVSGGRIVRSQLYQLGAIPAEIKVFDLGDFREGKTQKDTLTGWKEVLFELGKQQKIIIILGNDPEGISYPLHALSRLEHPLNLCMVSPDIHLINEPAERDASFLNRLLTDPESQLFDYVHLGYQSYFCNPNTTELLDKLYFSHLRLGELRSDIKEAEPHLRNSDMLGFSMASVRHSDAPGTRLLSANGLYAEEACQLARYAGLSDRLTFFHLFDLPKDQTHQTTYDLAAQMTWLFIQAVYQRRKDYPFSPIDTYNKYIVSIPGTDHEINFYRTADGDRWWLEVPYPHSQYERSIYVACTQNDYQNACNGEIPDKWIKNYQRIS